MTKVHDTFKRAARLRDVPLELMRINPLAQRDLNPARVDRLVADFDPEQIGAPTVSDRDGHFWIIDGQHRIAALKEWLGEWKGQKLQCWCYTGLTSEQEAETFLKLNDAVPVAAMPKFRAAVNAGRETQCDIDRIVRAQGLVVTADRIPGAVRAVGTLERVYTRSGGQVLGRSLRIIRDAYGDAGLEAAVIDGIGLLCQRYNGELDDVHAVHKLSNAHGGVHGLLNKAAKQRQETGLTKAECVAISAVEIVNSGRSGKKLPKWRS